LGLQLGKECAGERELALRECAVCRQRENVASRPRLYEGGCPRKVVVVCPGCWDNVESPWYDHDGIDLATSAWNERQAQRSGVEMRHCGTCQLWGGPREGKVEATRDRRRCLRQGCRYWEMKTSRHMGLECPDYLAQVSRSGER
jgi:hypothetical protein